MGKLPFFKDHTRKNRLLSCRQRCRNRRKYITVFLLGLQAGSESMYFVLIKIK